MSPTACADADAGVVDEHVQAPVARAVLGDDLLDLGLIGDVRGDRLHVEPVGGEPRDGGLELLGPPGGHRDAELLLAEHPGDRQADAAGRSGDDRCTLC